MKKIALIVLSAVILFAAPSCKKQDCKVLKHVVSEEYVYADPCDKAAPVVAEEDKDAAKKEEKTPRLWKLQARCLLKEVLEDAKIINNPRVVPIAVGYYECNDSDYRKLLYKAQVNGLVDVEFTDIVDTLDYRTRWINASLTPKGKALIVEDNTPIYPEDTITSWSVVYPNSGKNKYGLYTFDPYVNSEIVALIQGFYKAYMFDKNTAVYSFGTNDLILGQNRINKAKELGVRKNVRDPFTRSLKLDTTMINGIKIFQWTDYQDLFLVKMHDQAFCFVVKEENGLKKIDDIALNIPENLKKKNTWRQFALEITARELHDAQKAFDAKPKNPQRLDPVAPSVGNAPATPLLYDEYNPTLAPGIKDAIRPAVLPYQLAKAAEQAEVFDLLAFDKKLVKLGKIKNVEACVPTKKVVFSVKTVKVSPLGRICFNETDGEVEEYVAYFKYIEEEWVCIGVNVKEEYSIEVPTEIEIVPEITSELNDVKLCDCK